jgi:predicted ATPase
MTGRTIIEALVAGGPLEWQPEPDEKVSASVRRLVEQRLRERFGDRLRSFTQNQVDIDLRAEGGHLYRMTLRIDAARRYKFFWNNASEDFLRGRIASAAREGGTAVLLGCQLPPEGDRLLFWQIDMRDLVDARRRADIDPSTASFYIEPRAEGGWQLRYAGQVVLDLDMTTIHGAVSLAGFSEESPRSPLIKSIDIVNFKSVADESLDLGRLNVLVGANGSGKSAILEAIGVLGAAVSGGVDDASLLRRGVRLGALRLYKSAFKDRAAEFVQLFAHTPSELYSVQLDPPIKTSNRAWIYRGEALEVNSKLYIDRTMESASFYDEAGAPREPFDVDLVRGVARAVSPYGKAPRGLSQMLDVLEGFSIFDPQTPVLRGTQADRGPRDPLGLGGGKLAEAVQALLLESPDYFGLMPREDLFELLGWASDIAVGPPSPELTSPAIPAATEVVRFADRYLNAEADWNVLSGYDASEGALYVLFVLTLLFHPAAPRFFALENIDHTLHPRLARKLVEVIVEHIERAGRQIIMTTHNPLVLDALPLADDSVRLFAVDRNAIGHTVVHRVRYTEAVKLAQESGLTLSQMWTRGLLGAVPEIG